MGLVKIADIKSDSDKIKKFDELKLKAIEIGEKWNESRSISGEKKGKDNG